MMPDSSKGYTTYDSVAVARFLVALANERGVFLNITKVQKLLYISYGVGLAAFGQRIADESPRAWPYGPVFPKTREALIGSDFGAVTFDGSPDLSLMKRDERLYSCVASALKTFGSWTAGQLTAWSHKKGSPWWRVAEEDLNAWNSPIPDDYIVAYFSKFVKKKGDE